MYNANDMHYPSPPANEVERSTEPSKSKTTLDDWSAKLVPLERELRRDGWATTALPATETEVISREDANDVWFVHEAPKTQTATAIDVFQDDGLIATCAYQQRQDDHLYELLLVLNPGAEHALLLPIIVETDKLPVTPPVGETGTDLYSVITHPSGDRIGAVQHTTPSKILPDAT
jgi:hypothetical protein